MLRRDIIRLGVTATAAAWAIPRVRAQGTPRKAGFAQSESNNPWRIAETKSMQEEAQKRGWQLVYTDAASSAAKQVSDVNSMIAQGVDIIFLVPREERPLIPAVRAAKQANIPVILIDRSVDPTLAKAGTDYLTFIGSNFVEEGHRVGDWLTKRMNGTAKIIQLEGTVGSSPANDRKKGFEDAIKSSPGMVIVASQSGDFVRDTGRQVAQTLLQAHPDATAIYAHNDEMAIGAIAALEAAGKVPGKDVILCSVDGERDGVQAIIDNKIGAICECSPFFGPVTFDTADKHFRGEAIPPQIINRDRFYTAENAREVLASAF
ncbi:MAG: ABC transporter substrate-binding protein [Acidisphaera sp.]|nr:ABC transporter substrate-binding protein [Acidisphaera sp.]